MTASVDTHKHKRTSVRPAEYSCWTHGRIANCFTLVACLILSASTVCGQAGDALFIDKQGNVGIGTNTPGFPLTFPSSLGDKISLWGQSGAHFGFGIQGGLLQIHTNDTGSDIAFGYGKSDPNSFKEVMRIKGNGNVGIGTNVPGFPLTFTNTVGDKISLWGQTGNHFGFGIQSGLLQIHTDAAGADIAFGYGKSDSLTETMRIRGNGNLSVGDGLFVQGRSGDTASITKNAFLNASGKWEVKDTSKKAFTVELRDSGQLELYGTTTNGQADWRKMATFDAANNKIEFPGNAPVIVRGTLYVAGGFVYYWGPDKKWYGIEHGAGGPLSSTRDSVAAPSDLRLKTDLQPIPSAMEKVNQLRGVTFRWNGQGRDYLTRDIAATVSAGPGASAEENRRVQQGERDKRFKELSAASVGVVAQDVEAVLPEAVTSDGGGYKLVKYYELIPLIIEALKEEDRLAQEQAQTIARQQAEIQQLHAGNQATQEQLDELRKVKQKLTALEAAVSKLTASAASADRDKLASNSTLH